MPDMPPPTPDAAADDPSTDDTGGDTAQPTVLCTVMSNGDGTYTLVQGDEDEGAEEGTEPPTGADAGGGGSDAGAAGASPGTTYDSPGALLKAILDLVKSDMDQSGGGAQAQFSSGFTGEPLKTTKKSAPAAAAS